MENLSFPLMLLCIFISVAKSSDRNNEKWKWLPEEEHPCTVDRMTLEGVYDKFGPEGVPANYSEPLVIVSGKDRNSKLRQLTSKDTIHQFFEPGFKVTLSSSNSFSEHRRTITLKDYLQEISHNNGVTHPDKKSSELWYLFGETFSPEWKNLLKAYRYPPCQVCTEEYVALSFGIGNCGSGVQWHIHGPGFSEALHGRKHWVLYPPHHDPPHFHPDQSPRNWMEYIYPDLAHPIFSSDNPNGRPYECTLEEGDLLYFPDRWHHATINCDRYTSFISTFTSDHLFLQDQKKTRKGSSREQSDTSSSPNLHHRFKEL